MTKRAWHALVMAFAAGVVVEVGVRVLAQVHFRVSSVPHSFDQTFSSWFAPLPILVAAVASARAAQAYGFRSVAFVLPFSLSPHAFWIYSGERGRLDALAQHKWTASALAPAFAWVLSLLCVTAAAGLALFISSRSRPREAGRGPPPE